MKRIKGFFIYSKTLLRDILTSLKISWLASKHVFLLSILCECYLMLSPILIAYFFKVATNKAVSIAAYGTSAFYELVNTVIIMVSIQLLGVAIGMILEDLREHHSNKIQFYVHSMILHKVTTLDISFFDNPNYYNSVHAAFRDSGVVSMLSTIAISFIRHTVQIITCCIILYALMPVIPLLIALLMIPYAIIQMKFLKYKIAFRDAKIENDKQLTQTETILKDRKYAKEVRVYHTEDFFFERYRFFWKKGYDEKLKLTRKKISMFSITNSIPHITVGAILIYIATRISTGTATIGDFAYYRGISTQLISAFGYLITSFAQGGDGIDKMKNFNDFLITKPILKTDGQTSISKIEEIKFENVSFKYPQTPQYVLRNINLTLDGKTLYSLVGRNGAGKTTFVKLLLRLYDPSEGKITVNGIDLKDIDIKSYHKLLGIMFQDYNTYMLPLRDNIAMADLGNKYDDDSLELACHNGNFDTSPKKYVKKYDTYIGKLFDRDGALLSGGEFQKLAISRTYFKKDVNFYVMDEPNSALDPEAENRIFEKLVQLCQNKGGLFITHRMSTVTVAEEIIVLDKGYVVEKGPHSELMANNNLYAKLFKVQADKFTDM